MKKHLILFSLLIIGLSSCKKGDLVTEQAAIDDAKIQAYIKANKITAIKDPSGVYYQVLRAGTGAYPVAATSTVQVTSTGTFLNGAQFDRSTVVNFKLSNTIQGYQIGIPHINVGGRILLLVPSALGYGTAASTDIPANSVLVFTVDLIGFY